jgi:hypothetical protein
MTSLVCEQCHEHQPVKAVVDGVCIGCRNNDTEPIDMDAVTLDGGAR